MPTSDSLETSRSPFENVRWRHVVVLLEVLCEHAVRSKPYIEKCYAERASHFASTLAFLMRLGLAAESKGDLTVQPDIATGDDGALRSRVLDALVSRRSRGSLEVARYLSKYRAVDERVCYHPGAIAQVRDSAVRNFLMEMGFVVYSRAEKCYEVSRDDLCTYVRLRGLLSACPPGTVTRETERRAEIGLVAELAVLAAERTRVGPRLAHRVEHVAVRDATAGYDVFSVDGYTPCDTTPRFIEVKAVSHTSCEFYWSANEVRVARLLGPRYHLYLVPVGADGQADARAAVVISDAFSQVVSDGSRWAVETDVLRCRPRQGYGGT